MEKARHQQPDFVTWNGYAGQYKAQPLDVHFDEKGLYPFVSHSFAAVDLGQVGLVNVGGVAGTMSH